MLSDRHAVLYREVRRKPEPHRTAPFPTCETAEVGIILLQGVSGASGLGGQRLVRFAQFLEAKGRQPILLGVLPDGRAGVIESDARTVAHGGPPIGPPAAFRHSTWWRSLSAAKRALLDWPDPKSQRRWYQEATHLLATELSGLECEVVVSSGPPWVAHRLGRDISRSSGTPWMPDYRDLWTNDIYYPHPEWRRTMESRLERSWLRRTTQATSVTPGLCCDLENLAPWLTCHTIWNGYSEEELGLVPLRDLGPGPHVVYAGNLYMGKGDPEPVLDAFATSPVLREATLHLVVSPTPQLQAAVTSRDLQARVVLHGRVDRTEALSIVKSSDVALVIGWNDPRARDNIGGKIFELIGLRKPIVALVYPDGIQAKTVDRYGFGHVANRPREIAAAIGDLLQRSAQGETPDEEVVKQFDRRIQYEAWERLLVSRV